MSNSTNEIISKARGECRHPDAYVRDRNSHYCPECHYSFNDQELGKLYYDTDPSAWDEDLFEWIKSDGLAHFFIDCLFQVINCTTPTSEELIKVLVFQFIKATPAQKAEALARAIKRGDNKDSATDCKHLHIVQKTDCCLDCGATLEERQKENQDKCKHPKRDIDSGMCLYCGHKE